MPPMLPHGDTKSYARTPPVTGGALVGWVVMSLCFFPQSNGWFDGVVVEHNGGNTYIIFYASNNMHEEVKVPDPEIVFRCRSAGRYQTEVLRNMLPSL